MSKLIENIYQLELGLKRIFEVEVQLCTTQQVLSYESLLQNSYLLYFGPRNEAYNIDFYDRYLASGADLLNLPITKKLENDIQLSEYHGVRLYRDGRLQKN